MKIYTTAETIEVEQDERGFDLRITTEDGDDMLFNIQNIVLELVESPGMRALLAYHAEFKHAQQLHQAHLSLLDQGGMHSVRADLWPGEQ